MAPPAIRMSHGVLCGRIMFTKQVSRPIDSPNPIAAAEAQQVERLEEDLVTGPIRGLCAPQAPARSGFRHEGTSSDSRSLEQLADRSRRQFAQLAFNLPDHFPGLSRFTKKCGNRASQGTIEFVTLQ